MQNARQFFRQLPLPISALENITNICIPFFSREVRKLFCGPDKLCLCVQKGVMIHIAYCHPEESVECSHVAAVGGGLSLVAAQSVHSVLLKPGLSKLMGHKSQTIHHSVSSQYTYKQTSYPRFAVLCIADI